MIHGIQSTRFVRAERQPEHRMIVATALFSLAIHQCTSQILEVLLFLSISSWNSCLLTLGDVTVEPHRLWAILGSHLVG
jgi:hypothetical protein